MQVDFTRQEGVLTARLSGELDHHAAGDIRDRIDTAVLSCRCRLLILDFERISFMDSSGIGLIMGRYRLMLSLGGRLCLQGTGTRLERMIRLAGLDKLPIWTTQERKEPYETHQ